MLEKRWSVLLVSGGPGLRWKMQELERRFPYRVDYAGGTFEAQKHLESHVVHAIVCEASPPYTAEFRFCQEICHRSTRHPVILYVEPEQEEELFDELARGAFHLVRASAPLEGVHRVLQDAIEKARRKPSPRPT